METLKSAKDRENCQALGAATGRAVKRNRRDRAYAEWVCQQNAANKADPEAYRVGFMGGYDNA